VRNFFGKNTGETLNLLSAKDSLKRSLHCIGAGDIVSAIRPIVCFP